jgi:Transporter associated domain.
MTRTSTRLVACCSPPSVRIPVRGEVIVSDDLPGWEIEVLDADPRRIKTVRLVARSTEATESIEPSELSA